MGPGPSRSHLNSAVELGCWVTDFSLRDFRSRFSNRGIFQFAVAQKVHVQLFVYEVDFWAACPSECLNSLAQLRPFRADAAQDESLDLYARIAASICVGFAVE